MANREILKHHAQLFDSMASTLGHDLQEVAIQGKLSIDQITDAVLSCTQCSNPEHCSGWLASRERALQTPEYCRNRDLLGRLQP